MEEEGCKQRKKRSQYKRKVANTEKWEKEKNKVLEMNPSMLTLEQHRGWGTVENPHITTSGPWIYDSTSVDTTQIGSCSTVECIS